MADAINIDIAAKDLTKGAFSSVEGAIKHLTGTVGGVTHIASGMINTFAKLGFAASGIEAVGKTAAGMAQGLLKGNAALEMTTISFKTLLGSASAADDMIKQLTQFAANTPFELTGLEASTQKLLAFGFGAKDIIPLMTSMGDAISALGGTQDNLNSLVYVMGQMRGEAHLNAGDIMQMTNLGIPALQMLADHYKVTTGQMQDMISKGLVPGKAAVGIFTTGLEQKYGGMMKAQSATFSGMVSNLQDWATATTTILTKPLFEPAKRALGIFLDYVQSPAGVEAINKLAGYIQGGVDKITGTIKTLTPVVEGLWKQFQPVVDKALALYGAISPLSIAFDTISGVIKGGLLGGLVALEDHVIRVGDVFGINLRPAVDWFNNVVSNQVIPTIQSWANTFINDWLPKIRQAIGVGLQVFNNIATFVSTQLWPTLQKVFAWIGANVGPVFQSIFDTYNRSVAPALEQFFHWVGAVLWPKLQEVFAWIGTNVAPILSAAFDVIGNHIIPTVGDFINLVLTKLIPVLSDWWGIIATFLKPILEELGKVFKENILPAITTVWDFVRNKGIPAFSALADFLKNNVFPVLRTMADILGNTVGKAIGFILDRIKNLVDFWKVVITIGDKLLHGDVGGAISYAWDSLATLIKGPDIVISGSATDENNAAQVRLQQYMLNHPGYDPTKAGNAPQMALGSSSFSGGRVLWGEAGLERFSLPGGPDFYSAGPVYTPNAPAGSSFTPMSGSGMGGDAQVIHQHYYTIYGNPDRATMMQMEKMTERVVEKRLTEVKGQAQNLRTVNRTRG